MEYFFLGVAFIFGVIIGSFLNVVIYRLHTGRSINGHSHCLTCGERLRWYELFPIFSYLAQWGKCRHCQAAIPNRYLTVEVLTGLTFAWLWSLFAVTPLLFGIYAILASLLMVIAVYDLRHTIIPDELVLAVGGVAIMLLAYAHWGNTDWQPLMLDVTGGVGAFIFFAGLWFVSKGRWLGLGDAKLAFPLGILVGLSQVFSLVVLAFWIGAFISLALIGLQRLKKRGKLHLPFWSTPLTIKSEIPFAPFLILSFILVHFFHVNIFSITAYWLPY